MHESFLLENYLLVLRFLLIDLSIPLDSHIALYSSDVYWNPWSECNMVPFTSFLLFIASFNVSITNLLSFFLLILYATILLSFKSIIVDKYALFPLCIKYVTSVHHFSFSFSALKFLLTRSSTLYFSSLFLNNFA